MTDRFNSLARRQAGRGRRTFRGKRGIRSFILVEILVAVTILGIALSGVLRCFTNGLKAVSHDRRLTRAVFLAQGLLEDFEIEMPEEGSDEGDFGIDFPYFRYIATFEEVDIKYRNLDIELGNMLFEPVKKVTIEVYHDPPNAREPVRVVKIESFLSGIEKYAENTKFYNALY